MLGCSNRNQESDSSEILEIWHSVHVVLNIKDTITLYSNEDSLHLNVRDTFMKEFWAPGSFKKVFVDRSALPITKRQADSIFIFANNLIESKKLPENHCTDYYGNIRVIIMYSATFSKTVNYSSICEWANMDSNTAGIEAILQEVISVK